MSRGKKLLLAVALAAPGCASGPPLRNVPPADAVEPLVRAGRKVENAIAATKLLIERSRSADYLPDLHMRLAELYTEQARYAWLAQYEKRRARGDDSRALDVPAARLLKNLAVGTYEVILHDFPKYAKADEALFLMAHEYRELGEFERMKQTYEKLIADYPKSPHRPEAWLILGDTAFDAADLDRAEKNYNAVLASASSDAAGRVQPLARYKLAWVRINKEDCKGATSLFEKILRDRGTPRGTRSLVATQRSLNLHREALSDLAYCYPEVYPDKPAAPFMRSLADNSSDYIAAMRRVAKRFALKEMYAQAAAALREVLGAAVADEAALEDARKLYDNVIKAKVFDFAALDVERVGRVFEHRFHDYRLTKAERGKLLEEFEVYARDIATRAQLAARERKSPAMHAVAAVAYGHYLDYFRVAPDPKVRLEMEQNRAEALAESDRPFEAARAYERVAELVAEADPRKQARTNAIASYQQALDRGTLSRTERLVAWGGIRAQGRALIAEYPKDESAVKIKLGVARTFYDAGEYPAAAELFMALARQYPAAKEGVAAAHLALDAMRLAENYDRLATLGRQLLAMEGLGDAKFKAEVEGIIGKAEQRQVAELTIASSDDKQERLLSYAKRYKGSGLGEQALYNALLVARTEGDIDRFYGLGEEFIQQYPKSNLRIEVMGALASAASDRGDFAQAAQYLEAVYQADPRGKDALARLAAAAEIRAVLSDAKVVDDVKEMLARGAPRAQVDEVLLQSARVGNLPAVEEILRNPQVTSTVADFLRGYFAWQRGDREDAANRVAQVAGSAVEVEGPAGEAAGKARFLFGELVYEAYVQSGQGGQGDVSTALAEKSQLLQATDGAYAQAVQGRDARWALAALGRVSDAYGRFAAFLRGLKLPEDLAPAEREQLQQAFTQKADEAQQHARELREACAKKAREAKVFSPIVRSCLVDEPFPDKVALLPPPVERRAGGDPPGAAELRAALLKNPKSTDSLVKLAELYLGTGEVGTALLVLERAEAVDARRADVQNLKGVALERAGEPDAAYLAFKRAVDLDERSAAAHANLAAHFAAYGYAPEAQAELKKAGSPAVRGAPSEHPQLGALLRGGKK